MDFNITSHKTQLAVLKKNFLTVAVLVKILSSLQHLHLQIDLCERICIACHTFFKDHIHTLHLCQWSDTGPPGPFIFHFIFYIF